MEEKRNEALFGITKALEDKLATDSTEKTVVPQSTEESSSSGESSPQPFKKSIADMEAEQNQRYITIKEFKALKRSNYEEIRDKFRYSYVIRNKRTGLTVEVKASSSVHAANIIGWRPRHTELIEVIDTQKTQEVKVEEAEIAEVVTEVKDS